jgi:type VI secretion system protein ImpA
MQAGYEAAQSLAASLERHIEAGQGPDFVPLKKVLQRVADAGRKAVGDASVGEDAATTSAPTARAAGTISSREDANRALERVCEWIERNEPSNPAPLLIRRAQRLMSKTFIDIIRDLAPDGLKEVEKLAGIENT